MFKLLYTARFGKNKIQVIQALTAFNTVCGDVFTGAALCDIGRGRGQLEMHFDIFVAQSIVSMAVVVASIRGTDVVDGLAEVEFVVIFFIPSTNNRDPVTITKRISCSPKGVSLTHSARTPPARSRNNFWGRGIFLGAGDFFIYICMSNTRCHLCHICHK